MMGTRGRRRAASVVVLVAVAVATVGVAVTSAPAGNRDPRSTLEAKPGPAEVTQAKQVALTASLENHQKSTFTDVRFRFPVPAGATFRMTDCPSYQIVPGNPVEFVCKWGHQLRAGATATVLFVLQAPASGASMTAAGSWSIKEGAQNKGAPDTFPTNALGVPLISANDPRKAGTFATTACTNPSSPTIATNQVLGAGNPLATSICAPNLATNPFPGLVTAITERNHLPSDPGVSQVSDICIPAPGAPCGSTPFRFDTPGTFTFMVDNTALPPVCSSHRLAGDESESRPAHGGGGGCKLRLITKVFHDGQPVSSSPGADPRVVSITFSSYKKTTTVVVKSSENGGWDFG